MDYIPDRVSFCKQVEKYLDIDDIKDINDIDDIEDINDIQDIDIKSIN